MAARAPSPPAPRAPALLAPSLLAALLLAGCAAPPAEGPCDVPGVAFDDTVTRVVDGDTLRTAGCALALRLALVDTPEQGQPGHAEASAFTASLCPPGGRARVDLDAGQPLDGTGTRRVAVLACQGQNLNAALLEAGHAVVLVRYCRDSEFAAEPWAAPHCAP